MEIRLDDLTGSEIKELLEMHVNCMREISKESSHVLDLDALRKPNITFWTIWKDNTLAGCGALKIVSDDHAELKSMRTATPFLGQGVAQKMLTHIISEARRMGMSRLSLETGSMDYFIPSRNLYRKFGFSSCMPYGEYVDDPNSVFMTMKL